MKSSNQVTHKVRLCVRVLRQAWRVRPLAVTGFFAGAILQTASTVLTIYASAKLASLLAHYIAGQSTGSIWFWLWADIASAVLMSLSFWLMSYCKRLIYFRLTRWTVNEFFRALCTIDVEDFYNKDLRTQIDKAESGYTWQISNLCEACLDLVYGLIRFVVIALIVAQIGWWLIPLVALFLIPSLISESRLARLQWFVWDEKGDQRHIFWGLSWLIRQPLHQLELRSSQARYYVRDKIDKMNTAFYSKQENVYQDANHLTVPSKIIEAGGVAIGSVSLLRQFLSGTITLDRYFFLSGALLRIVSELNTIFSTLTRMQEQLLFAASYFAVIDRLPRNVDLSNAVKIANTVPTITFENLTFSYPNQTVPVFNNLNLTIKAGEHLAIVGENGAGKSTLIKLLMRFYKPDSGHILINGVDLNEVAIESWYDRIATLFQDFNHYPFPVKENIEVGRPQEAGSKERLLEAAEFGGVDKMVKEYEHGWETVFEPSFKKGIEPSGGQWQRVALARTFYRKGSVLILDEPTAAIDSKAEYEIFNNIFDHYKDKTTIIVSHRFSTVRRDDKIVVLDKGRIIEQGSHSELLKHKGLYHEMFNKQAEGYR